MAMTISAISRIIATVLRLPSLTSSSFAKRKATKPKAAQRDRADLAVGKNAFPDFGEYRIDGGGEHQQAPYAVSNQSYRRIAERAESFLEFESERFGAPQQCEAHNEGERHGKECGFQCPRNECQRMVHQGKVQRRTCDFADSEHAGNDNHLRKHQGDFSGGLFDYRLDVFRSHASSVSVGVIRFVMSDSVPTECFGNDMPHFAYTLPTFFHNPPWKRVESQ